MVARAVSRAFLSLLFLLTLGSCGLLTSSFFPEELMQVSARKDLSGEIPKAAGNSFMLSAVNVNGTDYVVLASNLPYDGIHVFLMDEGLEVVSAFTLEELNAPPICVPTEGFKGNGAFSDANTPTRVVVGNKWFRPSASGFVLETQPPATTGFSIWSSGFAAPTVPCNISNLRITSNINFGYHRWANDWSSVISAADIAISPDASKKYNLIGLFSDSDRQEAILVVHDNSVSYDDYFIIPWSGFGGLPSPLLGSTLVHFTRQSTEPKVIGYAQNGMIGFSPSGGDERSGEMIRFDLNGNTLPGSLHLEKLQDVQNAYPIAGGHYYSYNREIRVVTKLNAWWK